MSFTVSHVHGKGKKIHVPHAFVLPKVTPDMPANPIGSIRKWRHLKDLDLADPEYGTPSRIDVLIGADHYGEVLLHGRRWGPRGTPYAQRTCFGWVLAGPTRTKDSRPAAYICCSAIHDDSSEIEEQRIDIRDRGTQNGYTDAQRRKDPMCRVYQTKLETVGFGRRYVGAPLLWAQGGNK